MPMRQLSPRPELAIAGVVSPDEMESFGRDALRGIIVDPYSLPSSPTQPRVQSPGPGVNPILPSNQSQDL